MKANKLGFERNAVLKEAWASREGGGKHAQGQRNGVNKAEGCVRLDPWWGMESSGGTSWERKLKGLL